jgi:transcriptional regulator of heat shock response
MLTERQQKILECVVKEYTQTANPVGSASILKRYGFSISPATIRMEMAGLEKMGYLYQPHTSAGRIPTDKGYRYFVNSLMNNQELTKRDQSLLQEELLKLRARNVKLTRITAKLLAVLSQNLAISGIVKEKEYFQSGIRGLLSQLEFTNVDEIYKTVEMLDYLDQNIEQLIKKLGKGEVKILIGKENPLIKNKECSVVVSRCRLPYGEDGILAIMGPKRMRYARNVSLLKYVVKLLEEDSA